VVQTFFLLFNTLFQIHVLCTSQLRIGRTITIFFCDNLKSWYYRLQGKRHRFLCFFASTECNFVHRYPSVQANTLPTTTIIFTRTLTFRRKKGHRFLCFFRSDQVLFCSKVPIHPGKHDTNRHDNPHTYTLTFRRKKDTSFYVFRHNQVLFCSKVPGKHHHDNPHTRARLEGKKDTDIYVFFAATRFNFVQRSPQLPR
jgi:hypothetical protein